MKRCPLCARAFAGNGGRVCAEHGLPLVEQRVPEPRQRGRLSGHVLDSRYLLAGLVGKGGMGDVYQAENLRIGRVVAVKVLHPELHLDPKMRMRLFREVQATSRIEHPNVVQILDYGEDDKAGCYLVMEFLHGRSLGALIRRRVRLPVDRGLKICLQLAHALSATHGHGLIHRDLKPSNIRLLPNGRVKVLDFGLVKAFERTDQSDFVTITTGGIAFGTPWYMSPEQASLRPLDPRTDIYSLGVVLYELLVGRTPFVGNNALELIDAQRNKPVPLPRHLDPPVELPIAVELLLLQMLNKDPSRRPQSMAQLVDQLHGVAHEVGVDLTDTRVVVDGHQSEGDAGPPTAERNSQIVQTGAQPSDPDLDKRVQQATLSRMTEFCDRVVDELQRTFPRYQALDRDQALFGARAVTRAALAAATNQSDASIAADLKRLTHDRVEQRFPLGEALGSYLVGQTQFRPILAEVAQQDMARFLELHEQVDSRLLPFFLRLVDDYVDTLNARLIRLNDQLVRRNEELQQLREDLSSQLRTTSRQLGSLEQLKASLADNASSGLVVVERRSRKILLCNKAVERIFGVSRDELIERNVDDILRRFDGVPQDEFIEQIRLHGQVGLRKLRVRLPDGQSRVVYLRGEALDDGTSEQANTLFVIDDVTRRDDLVRSLSRYLPATVEREVLGGYPPQVPWSDRRRVPILGCQLARPAEEAPAPADPSAALSQLFTVCAAVARGSGATLTVQPPGTLLLCFSEGADSLADAKRAAEQIQLDLRDLANARSTEQLAPVRVKLALHLAEIIVADLGSDERAQRVVMGEGVDELLLQLLPEASADALLVSEAARH